MIPRMVLTLCDAHGTGWRGDLYDVHDRPADSLCGHGAELPRPQEAQCQGRRAGAAQVERAMKRSVEWCVVLCYVAEKFIVLYSLVLYSIVLSFIVCATSPSNDCTAGKLCRSMPWLVPWLLQTLN